MIAKTERFRTPTIACLGLTYKANVDDLRESPALDIVELIAKRCPSSTCGSLSPSWRSCRHR